MTTENNETAEVTAELAAPENIEAYVEERHDQLKDELPPSDEAEAVIKQVKETHPAAKEAKKASRYERLKRARDQYRAENEELRAKLGQAPEHRESYAEQGEDSNTGINPADLAPLERSLESARHMHGDAFDAAYEAFVAYAHQTRDAATYNRVMQSEDPGAELVQWHNEQGNFSPKGLEPEIERGRQEQEFQHALQQRDAEIMVQTEARLRAEAFAKEVPDFLETVQSIDGFDDVGPLMTDLIRRSNVGPEIVYHMARDYWLPNSLGLTNTPNRFKTTRLPKLAMLAPWSRSFTPSARVEWRKYRGQPKHLPRSHRLGVELTPLATFTRWPNQTTRRITSRRGGARDEWWCDR
jgi:hypothetical protein